MKMCFVEKAKCKLQTNKKKPFQVRLQSSLKAPSLEQIFQHSLEVALNLFQGLSSIIHLKKKKVKGSLTLASIVKASSHPICK